MGSFYPELLLDVCVVCVMGFMEDKEEDIRVCTYCGIKEITYDEEDFEQRLDAWVQ